MKRAKPVLTILLLAVLAAAFFGKVLAHPEQLMTSGRGDLVQLFAARTHYQVTNTLTSGELTLWDPYADCGAPVAGNIQNATFYPLNVLFYIMPTDSAFGFIFLLETFLAGLFAYLFARSFGLSRGAGLAGAIAYMFSGIWTPKLFPGHIMVYNNFPWIILGFYLVRRMVLSARDGKWSASAFFALLLALSQATQFLGGHTQFWVYSTFFLIIYCLFEICCAVLDGRLKALAGGGMFVGAMALCAVLIMVQLLPALEFAGQVLDEGARPSDYRAWGGFAQDKWKLALFPHYYGSSEQHTYWGGDPQWEVCPYVGILPLILTVAAVFIIRNRYVWYFACAGLVALLFSFGASSFVFQLLVRLPGFSAFRVPGRMLALVLPSVAVLTAFVWEELFANRARRRIVMRLVFAGVLLLLAAWAVQTFLANRAGESGIKTAWGVEIKERQKADAMEEHKMFYQEAYDGVDGSFARLQDDVLIAAAVFGASALLAGLAAFGGRLRGACGLVALALILGDLALFGMPFISTLPVTDARVYPEHTPLLDYLANDKSFYRIANYYAPVPYHQLRRRDYNMVGGDLDSSKLSCYKDYTFWKYANMETNDINNALNIKYFISRIPMEDYRKMTVRLGPSGEVIHGQPSNPSDSPFGQSVDKGGTYVSENLQCFPRAFVVREVVSMKGKSPEHIMSFLARGKIMKDLAVIEEEPDFKLAGDGTYQEAEITDYRANRLTVEVTLEQPGFLVLSEIWYPGWHAYETADGEKKELHLYKTNLAMRGVFLEAGPHKVEFAYEPQSYFTGRKITLIAMPVILVLLAGLGFLAFRKRAR